MIKDLNRAQEFLEEMADATTFTEYENAWLDFLYRLERVWELTKLRYQAEHWFSKVYGSYAKLRKKDPLLKYLKHARNAETHTIQGTLDSSLNVLFKGYDGVGPR